MHALQKALLPFKSISVSVGILAFESLSDYTVKLVQGLRDIDMTFRAVVVFLLGLAVDPVVPSELEEHLGRVGFLLGCQFYPPDQHLAVLRLLRKELEKYLGGVVRSGGLLGLMLLLMLLLELPVVLVHGWQYDYDLLV